VLDRDLPEGIPVPVLLEPPVAQLYPLPSRALRPFELALARWRRPSQPQSLEEWQRDLLRAADEVKDDDLPYEDF
jgi:hypothetical protein